MKVNSKINYRIEMERELKKIQQQGNRPLLVLHSCCAPCSSACLEQLDRFFRIVVFYYNPNISPESEFLLRAREQRRLIAQMPLSDDIQTVIGEYDPLNFYEKVKGHENDPEGGDRCGICFEMRLRKTAEYARSIGAEYFTTTLSISPLKDAHRLNAIGGALAAEYGLAYLFSDFKKKDGYRRSCALSEQYGLYRQDFCGCVFSRQQREKQKAEMEVKEIISLTHGGEIGGEIEFHAEIDSTNVRAKDLASRGARHGLAVLADFQRGGKGRFGRVFYSPEKSGLYISFVLRPDLPAEKAVRLTALAAVAVARTIEKLSGLDAQIKWVNDVYIGGKKACGILCEAGLDMQSGRMDYVVMGIGVNVGKMAFPEDLAGIATSVSNEAGAEISRNAFAAALMDEINVLWPELAGGSFMEEYKNRSNVIGRDVTVLRGDDRYAAKAVDIDDEGSLIVELPDGAKKTLHSGEISVRFDQN